MHAKDFTGHEEQEPQTGNVGARTCAHPVGAGAALLPEDQQNIRQLFEDYLRMYSSRDDRLTSQFSENFSGFTGGGNTLVKDTAEWVAITRQDFAQVKEPIRIEVKDLAVQALADTIAVATSFFTIHLPIEDHILSRKTARLVLIFRKESAGWKIAHSSISIPYDLVGEGEVYPLKELVTRNQLLEELVVERTNQLSATNEALRRANEDLAEKIAQHSRAAEALQRSEERYRSILHASPDDITITDREGGILMVSPMAMKMFGYGQQADFFGRRVTDFIVPKDRERALAQVALKLKGIVTGPSEYCGLREDGSTFDIEVNSEFIRDAGGAPTGMVIIVRDITERKQAELEREKLEAKNRQLQKAESLGRMAGAIAHHFNNQLQTVMLGLELALDDLPPDARPVESLMLAMGSSRKAAEVSGLMLTYLGQTAAKRDLLDLSAVCQRSLPLLRAVMPRSLTLETELPAPGPAICADPNQIQHVLANLVTNAWEASGPTQGVIRLTVKTVAAARIPAVHRFPVGCIPRDTDHACLEVADAGCGISEQDVEKIFDPFFTSKFSGRGMGLAVVLGVVRSTEGVITVESGRGRGSVFRVFLPVAAAAVPEKPVHIPQAPTTRGRGMVLVVEDEADVRHGVTRALKHSGFEVLAAEDGVQALEIFRQNRGKIGCVLCDLTMPRMDGWQTLVALRQLEPGIPVIMASGYSEAQVMAGEHPELPQVLLHKPYELRQLREAISQVMRTPAT
jgi:PAS domain S-box-containing protein